MQQREVLRHVERGESALSLQGAARVASDMLAARWRSRSSATWIFGNCCGHAPPSLLDTQIGSNAIAPPLTDREIHEWAGLRGSIK